uniref:Ornithine decarboxylase-like n=1 Tax=Nelumbo nucifera TaxID=4432 RepID=A0A822ZA63_NELNU|nr:TPA_asm: hypothetical protein HUJ06_001404 [Nelumbo nucifera]
MLSSATQILACLLHSQLSEQVSIVPARLKLTLSSHLVSLQTALSTPTRARLRPTFDSLCELDKIRRCHPKSKLLLRLKPPKEDAQFPLGSKFGALKEEVIPLLRAAQESSLDVIGVEFHVGSGARNPEPYRSAIAAAKQVFDTALTLGLPRMHVLDIGGGFKACTRIFYDLVHTINGALRDFFSGESDLTVIAEPGRFFAETSFTLATNIIGKRVRNDLREYWIDDGAFGSMNCILNSGETLPAPIVVKYWNKHGDLTCNEEEVITYPSTVFGPTCDASDTILRGCQLPELQVHDWLVFPNMGAYRASCGSNFNGFNTSAIPTHLVYSNPTTNI